MKTAEKGKPQAVLSAEGELFVLKELEGLGTDEVSAITGMTPDRIKSNLYHARKAIREMMSRQF